MSLNTYASEDVSGLSLFDNPTLKCYLAIWHRKIRVTLVCILISLLADMQICARLFRFAFRIVVHDMNFEVEVMWLFSWSTHRLQQKCYASHVPAVDNLHAAGTTNAH